MHHLGPGKVTYEGVAAAHAKDLVTEAKYGVSFIKYWVDTAKGDIYCLSSANNPESIRKTHAEAHGLLPDQIYMVTEGTQAAMDGAKNLYLDVHELGPGNVTAAAVAEAHKKDLAVENKYGVNFINYWVNEKEGVIMCLSEAPGFQCSYTNSQGSTWITSKICFRSEAGRIKDISLNWFCYLQ